MMIYAGCITPNGNSMAETAAVNTAHVLILLDKLGITIPTSDT
jgi:hypothetical protein